MLKGLFSLVGQLWLVIILFSLVDHFRQPTIMAVTLEPDQSWLLDPPPPPLLICNQKSLHLQSCAVAFAWPLHPEDAAKSVGGGQHGPSSTGSDNVCLQRRDLLGLVMHQCDMNSNAWFHRSVSAWPLTSAEQEKNGTSIGQCLDVCFYLFIFCTVGRLLRECLGPHMCSF